MEIEKIDSNRSNLNFNNVRENVHFVYNRIELLKKLVDDSKKSNLDCVNINKLELKSILDDLNVRYAFLHSIKTKRFIKKRISRRKRTKQINNQNFYDYKLDDLIKSKDVFGEKKRDLDTLYTQEFNETLDQYNKGLFELKQLHDFSQTLRKLIILRSSQKNSQPILESSLNEILKAIEKKRLEYEHAKKKIIESFPKPGSSSESNELFDRQFKEIRSFFFGENGYENQLTLEQLIYIRYEWDNFLTENYDRSKTLPIKWVEPNQNPNNEWNQFVKK